MKKELLTDSKKGDRAEILGLNCDKAFSRRLCDLGLFDGAEVEILKNDNFGPIVVKVFNSKIALGRGEASKIYAKKISTTHRPHR